MISRNFFLYYFDMKDLSKADLIFGLKIIWSPDSISISQSYCTQLLIDKFGHSDFSLISTPLDLFIQLLKNSNKLVNKKDMLKSLDFSCISPIISDLTLLMLFLDLVNILIILVGFIGLFLKEFLDILKISFHIILDYWLSSCIEGIQWWQLSFWFIWC